MNQAAGNTGLLRVRKAADKWDTLDIRASLRMHRSEYVMEAGEMSLYLFFTCGFATLLQHPTSPIGHFLSTASSAGHGESESL